MKSKIGTNLFRQRHGLIGAVQKVRNELNCYMFLVKYKQYVKYDGWLGLTYANREPDTVLMYSHLPLFLRVSRLLHPQQSACNTLCTLPRF